MQGFLKILFVSLVLEVSLQASTKTNLEAAPRRDQPTVEIGIHKFMIEVARTPQEWKRGLMFREKLASNQGMLFWGQEPLMRRFWMKNTLIPLDIIFIGQDLKIINIGHQAKPHSLKAIRSKKPALHVLEIKGGEAKKRGIKPGMKVKIDGIRERP